MRLSNLGNHLIDTDVFIEHVKKHHIPRLDTSYESTILMHGLYIDMYVRLVETLSPQEMLLFYKKFNSLLKGEYEVRGYTDIKDKYTLLCWIYYVQDTFL